MNQESHESTPRSISPKAVGLTPQDIASKLMHAGPAPLGTIHADKLPDMTLAQIGGEMLTHGGWVFGGFIGGDFSHELREALEERESARFEDFEIFSFGPNGRLTGEVFALAVELSSQFPDRRVVTLYVRDEILDEPGKIADHATKIVEVFSEMHAVVVRKSLADGDPGEATRAAS